MNEERRSCTNKRRRKKRTMREKRRDSHFKEGKKEGSRFTMKEGSIYNKCNKLK